MKVFLQRFGTPAAAAVAAVLAVAGGLAYAAAPGAGGELHGCYRTSGGDQAGQLRLVGDGVACRSNELAVQWNAQGPSGPAGPAGPSGADGVSPHVAQLAAGDPHCASGGASITDAAGATAYVCNGADGDSFAGTFSSPNGLYSLAVQDGGVTITGPGSTVRLDAAGINVSSTSAPVSVRGTSLDLRGDASAALRGGATTLVDAGATLSLRGGAVAVNGGSGCAQAARVGDLVPMAPAGTSPIITGSPTVCIG
jgi:hypothetical protein